MHGVPEDLDLDFLHGAALDRVSIGRSDVEFHFVPVGLIRVEGAWEVYDADGCIVDRGTQDVVRPPYQVHRLLDARVVDSLVSPPRWFELRFEGGEWLRIIDSQPDHESFAIEPGPIIV